MARWEDQMKANQPDWQTLKLDVDDISNGGQKYLPMKDDSLLAQGYRKDSGSGVSEKAGWL